jgi:hypothetical protein
MDEEEVDAQETMRDVEMAGAGSGAGAGAGAGASGPLPAPPPPLLPPLPAAEGDETMRGGEEALPPAPPAPLPAPTPTGVALLESGAPRVLCGTGLDEASHRSLYAVAKLLGAAVSENFDATRVTHVITALAPRAALAAAGIAPGAAEGGGAGGEADPHPAALPIQPSAAPAAALAVCKRTLK